MIPLGSCTMKLNAASEMAPVTWPAFSDMHPFAPTEQAEGYAKLFEQLEAWLADITGFETVCLQPNAGSQGEYAGLMVIAAYHASRNEDRRTQVHHPDLGPRHESRRRRSSPGMEVVPVKCDERGDIMIEDLRVENSRLRR